MKKILIILAMVVLLPILIACENETTTEQAKDIQLLNDRYFKNGFTISPADKDPQPDNRYPLDYSITYGEPDGNIMWLLGQAGNIYGLADDYALAGKEVSYLDGFYTIEDLSKKLIINPEIGQITFELNASQEFLSPRKDKEAWPHLIIQQGLSQQINVVDTEQIILSLDIELDKLINHMSDLEYNTSLHTAQFLMYIVVRSNAAQDAGEFLWFGIPFFDARYKYIPESAIIDAGTSGNTGKMIYQMPQDEFMPNGLPLQEVVHINTDIIPYLSRALQFAHDKGLMMNTELSDLYLTNMNIGFEVPGTFDISITISDFSLMAKLGENS